MRWRVPAGVAVALVLVWLARAAVVGAVLNGVGRSLRQGGEWLGKAPGSAPGSAPAGAEVTADPVGLSVLASWLDAGVVPAPEEDSGGALAAESGVGTDTKTGARSRLGPSPPAAVRLSRAAVLGLASGGLVPRGISRAAGWGMPPGIEIMDGGGLGIGWFPGDRLTHVEGVPVAERGTVVQVVLQRRAQGAAVISGTLARRTKAGVKSFQIIVEQPYLEPVAEAASAPSEGAMQAGVEPLSVTDAFDPAVPGATLQRVLPRAGARRDGASRGTGAPSLLPRP